MNGYPQTIVAVLKTAKETGDLSFVNWGQTRVVNELAGALAAFDMGSHTSSLDLVSGASYAEGVVKISAGSGAETATIGGRAVAATWATSDANTCDLLAAAINADATAKLYVIAGSRPATGTLTIAAGSGLISVTFYIPGPSGGVYPVTVSVTWATSDTATATALVAAVNATPSLPIIASSAAGVVTFYYAPPLLDALQLSALTGTASFGVVGNGVGLQGTGTGVTVSGANLTGGGTNALVLVQALMPGSSGMGITLAGSGTGVSVPTGANLVGGLGGPGNSSAS